VRSIFRVRTTYPPPRGRGQLGCVLVTCAVPQIIFTSSASRFSREQRRALKKLADAPRGLTEYLLMARGFSAKMLSDLVLAELATVVTEPMKARRGLTVMIERIHITDAGRRVIED
jgi:hypothetical protein